MMWFTTQRHEHRQAPQSGQKMASRSMSSQCVHWLKRDITAPLVRHRVPTQGNRLGQTARQ